MAGSGAALARASHRRTVPARGCNGCAARWSARQGSGHSVITPVSGGVTNSSEAPTFTVTDTTAEAVTDTAMDSTDGIVLAQKATVTFK